MKFAEELLQVEEKTMLDLEFIQKELEREAERLLDLAARLSREGKDLSPQDKALLRRGLFNHVSDILDEIKFVFLYADHEAFRKTLEHKAEYFKDLF